MRTAATLVAVLAVLGVAHASPSALKCATAATQLGACRSPPLAALAPAATETACCKPFLELLLSDCFWYEAKLSCWLWCLRQLAIKSGSSPVVLPAEHDAVNAQDL